MIKARTALILDHPFFGVLALKLKLVEDEAIPTASVNGVTLKYNPTWIKTLNDKERQGLLAHEVMHCVLQHMTRRQFRDPKKFNKACDYVINGNLVKSNFILPKDGLINHDYDDFTAEHVYNLLPDDDSDTQNKPDWNFGGVEEPTSGDDTGDGQSQAQSSSQIAQTNQDWQISVQQAVNAAKMQGKMPGNLERLIEEIIDPIIDWKTMLYKYIHVPVKDDYNWGRANRRFLHSGIVLPTLYSHGMGDVAIIIDTSGSISQKELEHFSGELSGICEDAKPNKVHVFYCDTQVNRYESFEVSDYPIKLEALGGGGTDMNPAFEAIAELDSTPECIVCLTDMYLNTEHINYPDCDTLWISTGVTNTQVKFGEITRLDI